MLGKSVVGLVIFDAVDSFVDIDVVVVVGPFIFDVVVDSLADSLIVGLVFFDVVDSSVEEILVCRVIFGVVGDVVEVWEHVR